MPRITRRTIEHIESTAGRLGIPSDDAWALRRAAITLHRWYEQECGDSNDYCSWCITRDESGRPFREVCYHSGGPNRMSPINDMERGAIRRVASICKRNGLHYYIQTDPRGGTLYLSNSDDLTDSNYSSRGTFLA